VKLISRALIVLFALCLPAWPFEAAGGVLIVEKTTAADGPTRTHHVQIDKDWMRMEHQTSGDKQAFIFDATNDVVRIVHYGKQTYTEMTRADVDRLGVQMSEAMARMQEQMKKLPPQQRAMMDAMLKGRGMTGGAAVERTTYQKVGTDRVGRWTCDTYEGYRNNQKTSELCTVDPGVLGFVAADFEVSRKLAEFFRKLVPKDADNMFSLGRPDEQGFSGVPVRRVFSVGPRRTTTEMVEVSRQSFPPATFEVPAGFRKQAPGER
jgi:hypothetical protein